MRALRMQACTRTASLWVALPRGCSQPGSLWAMWTLRTALPWCVLMQTLSWQMFALCLTLRCEIGRAQMRIEAEMKSYAAMRCHTILSIEWMHGRSDDVPV